MTVIRDPEQVKRVLAELDYPATKEQIVAHAERRGGPDEVLAALRALPLAEYENTTEVLRSVPTDAAEPEGQTMDEKAKQSRRHTESGLAEHMRDRPVNPIEEELGYNKGS